MSRAPKTPHARAISAYINKRITIHEFKDCCSGRSWISGNHIASWHPTDYGAYFKTIKRI